MPHAVAAAATGFQALILCGPGSSFPTFTANPDESPKALLPIANRPMLWYALDFCYRAGVTDITLICPPSTEAAITSALNLNPALTSLPSPSPKILAPKDLDANTGTAEILRLPEVREHVTTDFLVLPCDIVCELGGDKLLQAWMVKAASLSDILGYRSSSNTSHSGGLGVWYPTTTGAPIKGLETDFIATAPIPESTVLPASSSITPHLSKLVQSMPTDSLKDLVEEKNGVRVRHALVRKHLNVRRLTTHRDAHIYVFPHWVMDFVQENEALESIGEDVIGWWAKAGWQSGLAEKLGMGEILQKLDAAKESYSPENFSPSPRGSDNGQSTAGNAASKIGGKLTALTAPGKADRVVMPDLLAYIHPSDPSAPLIRRVDTAQLLLSVSLQLAKLPSIEEAGAHAASPFAHARKVAYPEGVKQRTTITKADSLVAENVTVDEKVSIKECVVGTNCQIQEGAKLFQCLLMDGVVVRKNCKLTKCVLGKRSEIGEGSILTECEVQENLLVEPKTEEKGEKLMSSEGLEATEEEMQEAFENMDEDGGLQLG